MLPSRKTTSSWTRPACTALALWAVAGGCAKSPPPRGPLAVVVSGDTAGWIVPCGCASNQSGGLPRRASYLAAAAGQGDVLALDAGGAPGGGSRYDRLKFQALLRGEKLMGVAAHNIGAAEAALGLDFLRTAAAEAGVPLVSSNVRNDDGAPAAAPLHIVERAGRRIAVLGVLSPQLAPPGVRVDPPRQAAAEALRAAAGRYDAAIVLAYLGEDELRGLAAALPEVDVVVGGPTGHALAPQWAGPVLLASATDKGKFLARFDAPDRPGAGWSGRLVELGRQFPDDPGQRDNVAAFRAELRQADLAPQDTSLAALSADRVPRGRHVAGTARCIECHQPEATVWKASHHAAAWQSLAKTGAEVDPDCQQCHTTAYGQPGGFRSVRRSGDRTQVGCENCHGPSRAHADDPKKPTLYAAAARQQCVRCHDRENSPKFEFAAYWTKVRHGEADLDAAPGPQRSTASKGPRP